MKMEFLASIWFIYMYMTCILYSASLLINTLEQDKIVVCIILYFWWTNLIKNRDDEPYFSL
jgi:hypothetical protein